MSKIGFIIGSGAQGRVALDTLRLSYPEIVWCFADDNADITGTKINGAEVKCSVDGISAFDFIGVHVALGKPSLKEKVTNLCKLKGFKLISAIHPSAVVSNQSQLGSGLFIGPQAVINTNAILGDGVLINTAAVVEHDAIVEDYANISPCACIGGRAIIGTATFVGSGAIVLARTTIGRNSIIGMGAVVNKNIEERTLAFGVPARKIMVIDDNFNWANVL